MNLIYFILFHLLINNLKIFSYKKFQGNFFLKFNRAKRYSDFSLAGMISNEDSRVNKSERSRSSLTMKYPMPITIISGFLGAGKTTFLKHMIQNESGKKFGLVVNDMASVNIDSKMIKQITKNAFDGVDTLELSNGCVCCSLAEDLIGSIIKLVDTAEIKKSSYDHIVVECSGIAEPRAIRFYFYFYFFNKKKLSYIVWILLLFIVYCSFFKIN
jgi:hypothetical protein